MFEDRLKLDSLRRITFAVDSINRKFGKHTVYSGATLCLKDKEPNDRDEAPPRRETALPGETARQRLGIPRLEIAC